MQEIEQEHFRQTFRLKNWQDDENRKKNIIIMLCWCDWMNKRYITTQEQIKYIVAKKQEYLNLYDEQVKKIQQKAKTQTTLSKA